MGTMQCFTKLLNSTGQLKIINSLFKIWDGFLSCQRQAQIFFDIYIFVLFSGIYVEQRG